MTVDCALVSCTAPLKKAWDNALWEVVLNQVVNQLPTKRTHGKHRSHCAKEILPAFVTNLLTLCPLSPGDVFWDCGSGIGNAVLQVAVQSKCSAWGVELQEANHEIACQTWDALRERMDFDMWEPGDYGEAHFHQGDMTQIHERFIESLGCDPNKILIFMNNYLFPNALDLQMTELFANLPVGAHIACMKPLFPIGRSSRCNSGFASAFRLSTYPYPATWVEWGFPGTLYIYTRADPCAPLLPAPALRGVQSPPAKRQRRAPPASVPPAQPSAVPDPPIAAEGLSTCS